MRLSQLKCAGCRCAEAGSVECTPVLERRELASAPICMSLADRCPSRAHCDNVICGCLAIAYGLCIQSTSDEKSGPARCSSCLHLSEIDQDRTFERQTR